MRPSGQRSIVLGIVSLLVFAGCSLPDRQPTGPVEIKRPDYVKMAVPDSAAAEVPLDQVIHLQFSEAIDPSTAYSNVHIGSSGAAATGVFSQGARFKVDSLAIDTTFSSAETTYVWQYVYNNYLDFTPSNDYLPSTVYHIFIAGALRDVHGNSLSIEADYGDTTWFLTSGDYDNGGWYPVFTLDKAGKAILAGSHFEAASLADTMFTTDGPEAGISTPSGGQILVAFKTNPGYLRVLSPDLSAFTDVTLGIGSSDIAASDDIAYVVNSSGQTVSKVDLGSLSQTVEKDFPDGFRPRNIAYDEEGGRIFLTSNNSSLPGAFRVLDPSDLSVTKQTDALMEGDVEALGQRPVGLVYSNGMVWLAEGGNGGRVLRVDPDNGTVVDSILVPDGALNAGLAAHGSNGYLFTTDGWLYRLDLSGGVSAPVRSLKVANSIKDLDLTPQGDLLYAVTPGDTTNTIIDPEYFYILGTARTSTTASGIAIGRGK